MYLKGLLWAALAGSSVLGLLLPPGLRRLHGRTWINGVDYPFGYQPAEKSSSSSSNGGLPTSSSLATRASSSEANVFTVALPSSSAAAVNSVALPFTSTPTVNSESLLDKLGPSFFGFPTAGSSCLTSSSSELALPFTSAPTLKSESLLDKPAPSSLGFPTAGSSRLTSSSSALAFPFPTAPAVSESLLDKPGPSSLGFLTTGSSRSTSSITAGATAGAVSIAGSSSATTHEVHNYLTFPLPMFHSVPPLNSVRPSGRIDIGPSLATTTPSLASISAGSSANGATVCVPPSATPNVVASPAAQHAPYSLSWSRVVNSSDSATVGGGRATAQAISLTSTSEPVDRTVRVTRTGTAVSATIVLSLVRPSATRTESARSTTGAGPSPSDGTYYGYGYSPNVHSLAASPASLLQPLPAPFHPTSSLVPVFTPETVGGAYGGGYGGVPLDSVPSSSEATETRTLTRTTARPVSNSTQPANASGTSAADAQQTTANPYGPPNGYVYGAPFSDAAAAPAPTSEPDPGTPYDSDSLSPGDQTNTLDDGSNDDGSNDDSSNDDSSNDDPGIVRRGGRTAAAVNPESRSGAHRNVATAAALTLGGLLFLAAL